MQGGWWPVAAATFLVMAGCSEPAPPLPESAPPIDPDATLDTMAEPVESEPLRMFIVAEQEESSLDGGAYRWQAHFWPLDSPPEGATLEWRVAGRGGGTLAEGQGPSFSFRPEEMRAFHVAVRALSANGSVAASATEPESMHGFAEGETGCLPVAASYESTAPACAPFQFPVTAHTTAVRFIGIASEWREEYTGTVHVLDSEGDLEARVEGSRLPGYEQWWSAGFTLLPGAPTGDWGLKWAPNQAVLGKMGWSVTVVSEAGAPPPSLLAWMGEDAGRPA